MPVHHHSYDRHLVERGLTNYWGYNTLAFFAPNIRYSRRGARRSVREFKRWCGAARAGIEVILDVVYNHTAEGNHLGPTLSLRGIDNAPTTGWCRRPALLPGLHRLRQHAEHAEPAVLQLIMDSLRYWVLEMHVDGFRFDLASALARELYEVDRLGAFFDIIHQDPVLSQVKLIAEPWDLGAGGYQVGNFPVLWTEWNGKYRDAVRRSGAATAAWCPSWPPAGRQQRPVRAQRPPAVREHQLRHRARRVHAARPRELQREAQRGQRRGQPRRRDHNLSWNCGVEGRPTTRRSARCASGRSATSWRRCCSRRACR
jgi:isoamylase